MSEEKQFDPTPSRLEKAKREGDVARSAELGACAAFASGAIAAAAVAPAIGAQSAVVFSSAASGHIARGALAATLALMLVPAGAAAIASFATVALQSGGVQFVPVRFKAERLSPAQNVKRMISRESAVAAARGIAAFACAAAALAPAMLQVGSAAMHSGGIAALAAAAWPGSLHACAAVCTTGTVFAMADYGLQVTRRRKRLRMTADELKRDQKEQDGDPLARGRRRSLHRQMARESLQRVKDAAFVVTNPTHIAIALEYRPPQVAVPRVLVRSADTAAARVRELAAAYRVPIVENVALARSLYANTRAGDYIPQEAYVAVAEIVMQLRPALGGREANA